MKTIHFQKLLSSLTAIILVTFLVYIIHPPTATAATNFVSLSPTSDIQETAVVGTGDTSALYRNVDDGTTFESSDNDTTYVRQQNHSGISSHTVGFANAAVIPSGITTQVTVNFRAKNYKATGTAKVELYDGTNLIGSSIAHPVTSSWANFTNTFSNLSVKNANNLRTKITFQKLTGGASGSLRYTQVWIDATIDGLSISDEQTLTANLETLSTGWNQDAVNSATAILAKPEYTSDDWMAYFDKYFNLTNHPYNNGLKDYLVYPTFYWYDDALHQKLQIGISKPLWDKLSKLSAEHGTNLGQAMDADINLRQTFFNSHQFFATIGNIGIVESLKTENYTNYKNLINSYPSLYKAGAIDTVSQPYLAALRAQTWIGFRETKPTLDSTAKADIAATLNLSGRHLDLWNSYSTLLHDNNALDPTQKNFIYDLMGSIPAPLLTLGNITQRESLGNNGDKQVDIQMKTGVNIVNYNIGAVSENSFPDDIAPGLIDVFSVVAAHEFNHVVDAGYIETNPQRKARKQQLITQAGFTDNEYLRSMVGGTFFQDAPQEFIASISNQWFANSSHTLNLAITRFDMGYKEPLNQFLYFLELYSLGENTSRFYRIGEDAVINTESVSVGRDPNGRITTLTYREYIYSFELDEAGNATSYSLSLAP